MRYACDTTHYGSQTDALCLGRPGPGTTLPFLRDTVALCLSRTRLCGAPSHSLSHTRIVIPTSPVLPYPLHVVLDWWSLCLSGSGPHTRNRVTSP